MQAGMMTAALLSVPEILLFWSTCWYAHTMYAKHRGLVHQVAPHHSCVLAAKLAAPHKPALAWLLALSVFCKLMRQ